MPPVKPQFDYLSRRRHILLDMHIPDWHPRFLSQFDPQHMIEMYKRGNADAVMVYCNSHAGECFYPTKVGRMHQGLKGRDVIQETILGLHANDIAVCGYYSSIFNNWAYREHPEWRIQGAGLTTLFPDENSRYGICCPNNPDYHAFQKAQVAELASNYPFDAFFFDMVFWTDVCLCEHCQRRLVAEDGIQIPESVDWRSPKWCTFQAARERWLGSQFGELVQVVKTYRDIPVFSNASTYTHSWLEGVTDHVLRHNDLVGGDFGFDTDGKLAYINLFAQKSRSVAQYMNAFSGYIGGSSAMKSLQHQIDNVLLAAMFGAQFMAIDAIEPEGTVNPAFYDCLSEVFTLAQPHSNDAGGRLVADVAVYFSESSRISLEDNGISLKRNYHTPAEHLPHIAALRGAMRALVAAHIPAHVITMSDLDHLADYRVIILPNVLRVNDAEVNALRNYVAQGGHLYASGYTSLFHTDRGDHDDFQLADVFGCHFSAEEPLTVAYAKPQVKELEHAIAPRQYACHGFGSSLIRHHMPSIDLLRFETTPATEVLATLTRPYGDGGGTRDDENWASIHASPPWEDTDQPLIVRHQFGNGQVIYSGADFEADGQIGGEHTEHVAYIADEGPRNLFLSLIYMLLESSPTLTVKTDENVVVNIIHNEEKQLLQCNILNMTRPFIQRKDSLVSISLQMPENCLVRNVRLTSGEQLACHVNENLICQFDVEISKQLLGVVIEYQRL